MKINVENKRSYLSNNSNTFLLYPHCLILFILQIRFFKISFSRNPFLKGSFSPFSRFSFSRFYFLKFILFYYKYFLYCYFLKFHYFYILYNTHSAVDFVKYFYFYLRKTLFLLVHFQDFFFEGFIFSIFKIFLFFTNSSLLL
jgi:hypothetical protein